MSKKYFVFLTAFISLFLIASVAHADITDCKPGYKFNPRSGVGCQQINCGDIPDAHYSYTGYCICGSSGSINENPDDPNKECSYPSDHTSCPGCVYACVHLDEDCPGQEPPAPSNPTPAETPSNVTPSPTSPSQPVPQTVTATQAGMNLPSLSVPAVIPAPTTTPTSQTTPSSSQTSTPALMNIANSIASTTTPSRPQQTCTQFCARLTRGRPFDDVLKAEGTYPNCECIVDNKDDKNRLDQTIIVNGDKRTTYIYDPNTGELIKKITISISEEKERIRKRLGYKYDEDQIDQMLDDAVIDKWFADKMKNITTVTSITHAQFWWQHWLALMDHGFGNSTDFVDTNGFGRCGDSMMWLEQHLAKDLALTGKHDKTSEAILSITGEKYRNTLNHTALIVRPPGFSNIAWADTVQDLMNKTQKGGLTKLDIQGLDPKLLDAKVLDPYFKKTMTVREFIKGWSVVKIS